MKRRDTKRRRRPGVLLGAAVALALGALILAGCGGSSGGGSAGAEGSTSKAEAQGGSGTFAISAEAKTCLKEKGVELPGFKAGNAEGGVPLPGGEKPTGGPPAGGFGGKGKEKMLKAFEECGVETPPAGGPGKAGAPSLNSAAFKKQVRKYVACVRENGYELAEPNFSGEGPIFEKAESESAAFKKASAKCQGLLGGPAGSQSG